MTTTSTARVQKRRDAMRAAGLRPIQIWVPDTRLPTFAEECRRQSLLIANGPREVEMQEWLEAVADTDGWTE